MIRLAALLLVVSAAPVAAQKLSEPQPSAIVDTVPAPRDIAYPGTMRIEVDATDNVRGILRVKQTIPVARDGPMVLLYPKWLPGYHAPRGEIDRLAGLIFRAGGKRLDWNRDALDPYAFHIDVPRGARQLDIELQYLSATLPAQGRVTTAPMMMSVKFNSMSLYPAGYFTRRIPVVAKVTYPAGWTAVSGLPSRAVGTTYTYDATNYEVLVDSPVTAGRYYQQWQLTPRADLNMWADDPGELEAARPEQIAAYGRTVTQAEKLFGWQPYDRFEFLHHISAELGNIGLEHHRSTEIGVGPGFFKKWDSLGPNRNVVPHELVHSWNGKHYRPADLWTPDFRTPMRSSLLWVYEGQTQFWGYVLQARSGLVSKQDTLDAFAIIAAGYDIARGRDWRDLQDTVNDPTMPGRGPKPWISWQRSAEDYYNEGLLIWLEVDAIIREASGGRRSIDDFARAFFRGRDGDWGQVTYRFEDVVAALNGVVAQDWAAFLRLRLTEHAEGAPLAGITRNGYRLVYTDTPTEFFQQDQASRKVADFSYSLGMTVGSEGEVAAVTWEGPAFKAGLVVGTRIIGVGALTYSDERLADAIAAAKGGREPIQLTVRNGERVREFLIAWNGGNRYPRLEKAAAGETGLDRLLAPL